MAKRKRRRKGMKVGQTVIRTCKVNGKKRKCYITKMSREKYRRRLVTPRTKHYKGKGRKSGAGHFNYGRSWHADTNHPYRNKRESWERRGKR